jgi:hypothetical protein
MAGSSPRAHRPSSRPGWGTSVIAITLPDKEVAQRTAALVAPLSDNKPLMDGNMVELTVENGPKVGAEVLRTLDAAQIPVAGLALREPSLDDVFLSSPVTSPRGRPRRNGPPGAAGTGNPDDTPVPGRVPTERTPHDHHDRSHGRGPGPAPGSRLRWTLSDIPL